MGAEHGFLLTPDAPEVLDFYRQPHRGVHGRALRRHRAAELGQSAWRRHPDHADDPDRPAVGAAADPGPRPRRGPGGGGRRLPAHPEDAPAAGRRLGALAGAQRGRLACAARRPAVRHGDGVGARRPLALLPPAGGARGRPRLRPRRLHERHHAPLARRHRGRCARDPARVPRSARTGPAGPGSPFSDAAFCAGVVVLGGCSSPHGPPRRARGPNPA